MLKDFEVALVAACSDTYLEREVVYLGTFCVAVAAKCFFIVVVVALTLPVGTLDLTVTNLLCTAIRNNGNVRNRG